MKLKKILEVEIHTTRRITTHHRSEDILNLFVRSEKDLEEVKKLLKGKEYTFYTGKVHCVDEENKKKFLDPEDQDDSKRKAHLTYCFLYHGDREFGLKGIDDKTAIERIEKEFTSNEINYEKLNNSILNDIENGVIYRTKEIQNLLQEIVKKQYKEITKNKKVER